jgi:pilus assembly protein CpaE
MRTLLVSNDLADPVTSRLRNVLRTRVDDQGPATAEFTEVAHRVPEVGAELLVVVLSSNPESSLKALHEVRSLTPGYVLVVGPASDADVIMRALHEGADHYLSENDLEKGLDSVLSRWQSRSGVQQKPVGRVIALLATSGGTGTSTLAVNLAAILARDHGKSALIDLKSGKGDLAALLDLEPAFHMADLCRNVARLDQAMFEKVLTPHASGIHLLASPQAYGDARLVSPQGVSEVLSLAVKHFPFVVVDLEDCFHEEQVLVLRQASIILLVSRLDFTSLRNVRRIRDQLHDVGVDRTLIRLAINRQGQPNELPAQEAEEALGGQRALYVPDDPRTINGANNTGVPAVLKTPGAKVSQAIVALAKELLERRRAKSSLFAKLFSA